MPVTVLIKLIKYDLMKTKRNVHSPAIIDMNAMTVLEERTAILFFSENISTLIPRYFGSNYLKSIEDVAEK